MKTLSNILILILPFKFAFANEIDGLRTKDDVQHFLSKVFPEWEKFQFFGNAEKEDTIPFGKGKFFKLDLDNNGLTDIVIDAKYFFAVTDNGNEKYESHFIDRGVFMLDKHTLNEIIHIDKTPLLIIGKYSEYNFAGSNGSNPDTLIMKFGDFYEYNSAPYNLKLEELNFSTSYCFGTCPVFELKILGDRSVKYHAIDYNEKKGNFKTILDSITYNKLMLSINYIKWGSLKDEYSVDWTDDQTATLEIKFSNGHTKRISDYGMIGTFGLKHLYHQLFALRKSQNWKK